MEETRSKRCATCSSNLDSVQRECCISSCWWLHDRADVLARNCNICNCVQRSKFCVHTPAANSLPWSMRFEEFEDIADSSSSIGLVIAKLYIPVRTIFGPLVAPLEVRTTSAARYSVGSEESGWNDYNLESDELCNWMKFIRQAEHTKEQNLTAFQWNGAVYFAALEGIIPGDELKVYYANNYAAELGKRFIPVDQQISLLTGLSVPIADRVTEESHVVGAQVIQENLIAIDIEKNTSEKVYIVSELEEFLVPHLNEDFASNTTLVTLEEDTLPFFEYHAVQEAVKMDESPTYQGCSLRPVSVNDCMPFEKISAEPEPKSVTIASALTESENNSNSCEPATFIGECPDIDKPLPGSKKASKKKKWEYVFRKCHLCQKSMPHGQLSQHYRTIHCDKNGIYSCPSCPKTTNRLRAITVHVRKTHMPGNSVCSVCFFTAKNPNSLRSHMVTHSSSNELWECGLCGKCFSVERNLRRHLARTHNPEREETKSPRTAHVSGNSSESDSESEHTEKVGMSKSRELQPQKKSAKTAKQQHIECVFCLNSVARKDISRHYKTHCVDGLYKCRLCGKTADTGKKIREHDKRFHKPTRYNCTLCPFSSKSKRFLGRHVLTNHPKGGTWKCDQCEKNFVEYDCLQGHLLLHSKVKPEKTLRPLVPKLRKCDICDKTFKNRSLLLRHSAVHKKDLPWICDLCGGGFKVESSLQSHVKYFHDPKREAKRKNTPNGGIFKCVICSAEFYGYPRLQQHVPNHIVDDMYSCIICQQTYRTYKELREHYQSHQPKIKDDKLLERTKRTARRVKKQVKGVKYENCFYKCRECKLGFTESELLIAHLDALHPDLSKLNVPELNFPRRKVGAFQCLRCKRLTLTEEDARQHFRFKHPQVEETLLSNANDEITYFEKIPSQDTFWCEICNSAFANPKFFLTHVKKTHPGYFVVLMTPLNVA